MKIGMVLLAAGKGERFGQSKLETQLNNKPIIEYILSNIPVSVFHNIVIVAANNNILNIAYKYKISGIINSQPELGLAKSIEMGTRHVHGSDAYMYCVSDQPLLKKSTIENMVSAYKKGTMLALSHNNKRGNPVIFPDFLYDELVSLKPNETGQKVINAHLDILEHFETLDYTELMDIDTPHNFVEIKNIIDKKAF